MCFLEGRSEVLNIIEMSVGFRGLNWLVWCRGGISQCRPSVISDLSHTAPVPSGQRGRGRRSCALCDGDRGFDSHSRQGCVSASVCVGRGLATVRTTVQMSRSFEKTLEEFVEQAKLRSVYVTPHSVIAVTACVAMGIRLNTGLLTVSDWRP